MRQVFAGLGWAVLFAVAGAVLLTGSEGASLIAHPALRRLLPFLAGLGAAQALPLWLLAWCFGALPGARWRPGRHGQLGALAGLWGVIGMILVMAGFALFTALLPLLLWVPRAVHAHSLTPPDLTAAPMLAGASLAGELGAMLWLAWFLRGLPAGVRQDGGPAGIAWRRAPGAAYAVALGLAILLVLAANLLLHDVPPQMTGLRALPAAKLLSRPGWAAGAFAVVLALLAPVVEEISFRGIAFAGLARRFGTAAAVILTTALFTALHAPEKLHYLPGFAGVAALALAACWLRLRYRSIRPGLLLHVAYNTGLLVAAPLLH